MRLYSRPGNDLTDRFPLIVEALARLRSRSCIIHGEAVACDGSGIAQFNRIRYRSYDSTVFLYAFDLIELNGDDLRSEPPVIASLSARTNEMPKERLAAFSDGVFAIIITIMVLELKVPHGDDLEALSKLLPVFLSYVLSFIYVGIYWNNHHHLLHASGRVDGSVLWANMHLLFWLSLIPFATGWTGENHFTSLPTAIYGVALLMPAIAWFILQRAIIKADPVHSTLAQALGRDFKGKISPLLYLAGIGIAFVSPWISNAIYVLVALIWLVPDRRIENVIKH